MQVVVTDAPSCAAVTYAQANAIPVQVFPPPRNVNTQLPDGIHGILQSEQSVVDHFQQSKVDYVLLAGYLKLVPAIIVGAFHRRMLNIHPGLLPAFGGKGMYGRRVHQAVISSGARCLSACLHLHQSAGKLHTLRNMPSCFHGGCCATGTVTTLAMRFLMSMQRLCHLCRCQCERLCSLCAGP
jgi:phosphoribosylglycinamide formyltransferase